MKKLSLPDGISIRPISIIDVIGIRDGIESDYRERGEPVDPPTYEVPVAGSDETQTFEHVHILNSDGSVKESTLETDEDKQAWIRHIDALNRMNIEISTMTSRYLLLEGVVVDWEKFAGWEENKAKYKIQLPADPDDKFLYFLRTVPFKTPESQDVLAGEIYLTSIAGSDPEKVRAFEKFFRRPMEEKQK